jgi:glycosyltransferase involved in cell wall biosynthesis
VSSLILRACGNQGDPRIGPLEAAVRARAAALGLGDRLVLAGVTDDVAMAMAAMDVVVLTSQAEGLPNVVLEAQALGRPVVTTRAGGVAEALREGETGLVVDDGSPRALADAVERAMFDGPWRAHAQAAGPRFIREAFSVARMVKATLDVYEDCVGHDSHPPHGVEGSWAIGKGYP